MNHITASAVYHGSDGELTKHYYAKLTALGPIGIVAVNLFRAQKCSTRAKAYRGRRYKDDAHARKAWSIGELVDALIDYGQELGLMSWGWKLDPAEEFASWVLYVDLPGVGQVSFHCTERLSGPDYQGKWDGRHASESRILEYCKTIEQRVRSWVSSD